MTHTLHREGSVESLGKDFILFVYPARGFNYKGSAPKVRHLAELIFLAGPVSMRAKERPRSGEEENKSGEDRYITRFACGHTDGADIRQEMLKLQNIKYDGTLLFSIFKDREELQEALTKIKEADEGISIVVSGIIDDVREIIKDIGIDPHMINLSLGIHGRTDRLPPADIREFTSMCGHGVVSPYLVKDMIRRIKTGKISEWKASQFIGERCACGIYNPCRSAELFREKAPLYAVDRW
jgi:hypothetical protein